MVFFAAVVISVTWIAFAASLVRARIRPKLSGAPRLVAVQLKDVAAGFTRPG